MSPAGTRRLLLALAGAALLLAGGGFLRGLLDTGGVPAARTTTDTGPATTSASRDPVLALRALGARQHWGSYTPPTGEAVAKPPPVPRTVEADAIAQAYRLVGVEHRDGEPQALLLPSDAPEDSAELIRLHRGEQLVEGVSVSAIGADSVRFSTASGSSTLYLYGSAP
jgi:hypothetical protein